MLIKLFTNSSYQFEIEDVIKAFGFEIDIVEDCENSNIQLITSKHEQVFENTCSFSHEQYSTKVNIESTDPLEIKRIEKRYAKLAVYHCLKKVTGKMLPWGALTGIRPTKLAYEIERREKCNFKNVFNELFDVQENKINLVETILDMQKETRIVRNKEVDLYVNIPFCVTKCSYCSFPSGVISKMSKWIDPYCEALLDEINQTVAFANDNGLSFRAVYFGGGTPTSLTCEQLERLINACPRGVREFTIEAGRPDTITKRFLDIFKENGVDRISINPQSFNQKVLDAIGRSHSVEQIFETFEMAKSYDFTVNMDFIAGLPEETFEMFCNSIDTAINLCPHNITVHTLAMKKGSQLKLDEYKNETHKVKNMVDYAHLALQKAGYKPYYMYRQKYMSDNLENVGFCLPDYQCVYNIDNMEETTSILACGANAISKKIFDNENRIERIANPKDVQTYLNKYQSLLIKKFDLFSK